MRCGRLFFLGLFITVSCSPEVVRAAEDNLDRTLSKLAASMLRECPDLKGKERSSEARQKLVDEFEKLDADSISKEDLKKIRRAKVDYGRFDWKRLVKDFDQARFEEPKMQFLLNKAKAEKMRGQEYYVVFRLMKAYYETKVEERTLKSKRGLSRLGKQYTAYLKKNGEPPRGLEDLLPKETERAGMNPLTGEVVEWLYVGKGPAEIRGGNRYRLVAYAPFAAEDGSDYRWVVYKGGRMGSWKIETLQAAVQGMSEENSEIARSKIAVNIKAEEKKMELKLASASVPTVKKKSAKATKPKLKITILELW